MVSSTESTSAKANPASWPTAEAIDEAAGRIAGRAVVTPVLEWALLNERVGARVLIKPEIFQRTGSFKFRGAYNRVSQIPKADRPKGVVAFSSGNHAQGVAAAAQLLGIAATIVMPADAPRIKLENTRNFGARIITYDRAHDDREAVAAKVISETGATLVRPFDDPEIIAGQGTVGRELAAQAAELGARLDAVLVPCGGGGLMAGCALAIKAASPTTRLYAVEPAGFDETARSLDSGERQANAPGAKTFCDALTSPMPGELTFAINKRLVERGFSVSDREVAEAMAFAFNRLKLVIEPGGAVALAAILAGKLDIKGGCVGVVCSGGNVDAELFARTLSEAA
jgi:threonine dehydratase